MVQATKSSRSYALLILISLAAFSILASLAGRQVIEDWERGVFDAIYSLPDSMRPFFLIVTQFGSAVMLFGLTLALILRHKRRLALNVLLSGTITYLIVQFFKWLVDRPRPEYLLDGVTSRELLVGGQGFPSGHTALATVIGLIILPHVPRAYQWLVWAGIFLVGISRIYLGVHAPLDVAGGFLVGLTVATLPKLRAARRKRVEIAEL